MSRRLPPARRALLGCLLITLGLLAGLGCSSSAARVRPGTRSARAGSKPSRRAGALPAYRADSVAARRAGATARSLDLAQLAGERVIFSYPGAWPPASLLGLIRAGEVAGVILFSPNTPTVSQTRAAVAQMQRAALASPVHRRLLILTDQEGGEVRRLPGGPTLSERQIGASRNPAAAAATAGVQAGHLLGGAGVNVNLAPVLDVYRRPGNFIDQYGRAYSGNPRIAAAAGGAFITAQQRLGVAATVKHFPGLGAAATAENTDERPVTLRLSLATLRGVDELPYRTAIADHVDLVMCSWAVYPALDPTEPAGMSARVIGGELRGRLGFRGVTITDGIDAGAVSRWPLATRVVRAASAGADLILAAAGDPQGNGPGIGQAAVAALESALRRGQLNRAAAEASAARVLALRAHP